MTPPTDDLNPVDARSDGRKRRAEHAATGRTVPEQTENAIRLVKRRKATPAPTPERNVANRSVELAEPVHARQMPEEIVGRFIAIGTKYYFPDGSPAFVDRGDRLTTPSENTEVIRSLITVAQARGWTSIAVSGTERFRREAWFAAQRAGLSVRGYKASDIEKAQLVRSLAQARTVVTGNPPKSPQARGKGAAVFVGKLLDHGSASYRHDPKEQASYYLRLKTPDGEREVWGVDLERALRHSLSQAKIGDDVTVRAFGREPVTVPAAARNAEGGAMDRKSLATHRNEWSVERTGFLAERARIAQVFRNEKITPEKAVKEHPELHGSYLKLKAVVLGAERDISNVQERDQLIARARVLIAQSIERGEPLEPVQLREPRRQMPDRHVHRDGPTR